MSADPMAAAPTDPKVHQALLKGIAIPATPLALNASRKFDERRQRALYRYYRAAGASGLAVGVHTTQFAIRDAKHGLLRPVLELAAEEMDVADARQPVGSPPFVRVAGVVGNTDQAVREAGLARDLGYHAGLLSLAALHDAGVDALIAHCRAVAEVIPVIGFYLQPSVGGRVLPYAFWRRFVDIPSVVAIKIAPFNRYQTIDVIRALAASDRCEEVALYTGNDDNIVVDLLTPYEFKVDSILIEKRIVGGLLGQWAVWTQKAVELFHECRAATKAYAIPADMLRRNIQVTDANAAFFDAANAFKGCIAGLHEVLRRQGLLEGIWLLDERETLSPGQAGEIDRVYRAYPHLNDDRFVAEHLDGWLR
jgi:dihydrodipicolinate synthase/N-acetylneuraminate lyase